MSWCAFKYVLGFDCPGCGLTRSIIALLTGNVSQSLILHPMGVVVVLWFMNLWWWRHFKLSPLGLQLVSHGVLLGFLVPWVVNFFI